MKRLINVVKFLIKHFPEEAFGKYFGFSYAKMVKRGISAFYQKVADEVVTEIKCGDILDVGTGPCYLPIEIVKRSRSIRVVGLGISSRMMDIAQKSMKEAKVLKQISLVPGDENRLPFRDETFDMVLSIGVLFSSPNPVRILNECRRVLKHEREAWIYDFRRDYSREEIKLLETEMSRLSIGWFWRLFTRLAIQFAYTIQEFSSVITKTIFEDYKVERAKIGALPLIRVKLRR